MLLVQSNGNHSWEMGLVWYLVSHLCHQESPICFCGCFQMFLCPMKGGILILSAFFLSLAHADTDKNLHFLLFCVSSQIVPISHGFTSILPALCPLSWPQQAFSTRCSACLAERIPSSQYWWKSCFPSETITSLEIRNQVSWISHGFQ